MTVPPLLLFVSSQVYGRRPDGNETVDLSFQLAKVFVEAASLHGVAKAVHLALPEYFGGREELLAEFELDKETPIVYFSFRAAEDHRYLKGADISHYVDIEGESVGDHALGANLPKSNLGVDDVVAQLLQYCPTEFQLPLHRAGGKLPLKHSLALARLRIKLQQQRSDLVRARSLLVLYPDHDELFRLGYLLDRVGHRFDVALNLLIVTAEPDGDDNALSETAVQLFERHTGIVRIETQDLDLVLISALRDMGFELFSSGYRCRVLFETVLSEMMGMKVASQNFDGTFDRARHPLWNLIRLDSVLT